MRTRSYLVLALSGERNVDKGTSLASMEDGFSIATPSHLVFTVKEERDLDWDTSSA